MPKLRIHILVSFFYRCRQNSFRNLLYNLLLLRFFLAEYNLNPMDVKYTTHADYVYYLFKRQLFYACHRQHVVSLIAAYIHVLIGMTVHGRVTLREVTQLYTRGYIVDMCNWHNTYLHEEYIFVWRM